MGFNIPKHSGDRSIPLEEKLDKAEAEKILFSYLPMVVHQMTIEEIVKSSFAVNPGMLLYLLARIFFAAKQKLVIELTYKSSRNENENKYILHPYYWVYREQSIYLVAYNTARTQKEIFRITRISSVRVLEKKYPEELPDVREIFQNSGGVFVNDRHYDIVLSAAAGDINLLSENFGYLDASVREDCGRVEFSFSISDLYWLCQRLLPLEGRIKITGSDETVQRVKQMMKSAVMNFF
jgi:predicted DNA-binding transcriptional regulator YafY